MTTIDSDLLIAELEAADDEFDRPAVPSVFAEYERFMETGRYPYIDSVVCEITDRHNVPGEGRHHPFEGLRRKLCHEVYLASGEHDLNELIAEETRLLAEGWKPIPVFEPRDGATLVLTDGLTYRCRPARNDNWCLLPPRKRTHGINLGGLISQHRAFWEAKAMGQTKMNNPRVRMYRDT